MLLKQTIQFNRKEKCVLLSSCDVPHFWIQIQLHFYIFRSELKIWCVMPLRVRAGVHVSITLLKSRDLLEHLWISCQKKLIFWKIFQRIFCPQILISVFKLEEEFFLYFHLVTFPSDPEDQRCPLKLSYHLGPCFPRIPLKVQGELEPSGAVCQVEATWMAEGWFVWGYQTQYRSFPQPLLLACHHTLVQVINLPLLTWPVLQQPQCSSPRDPPIASW